MKPATYLIIDSPEYTDAFNEWFYKNSDLGGDDVEQKDLEDLFEVESRENDNCFCVDSVRSFLETIWKKFESNTYRHPEKRTVTCLIHESDDPEEYNKLRFSRDRHGDLSAAVDGRILFLNELTFQDACKLHDALQAKYGSQVTEVSKPVDEEAYTELMNTRGE